MKFKYHNEVKNSKQTENQIKVSKRVQISNTVLRFIQTPFHKIYIFSLSVFNNNSNYNLFFKSQIIFRDL